MEQTIPAVEKTDLERDLLMERILQATNAAFDVFAIYIGDRLGFYRTLAQSDSMTAGELAAATGTEARYVREWLEQQTVSGFLRLENAEAAKECQRFSLPSGHAEVLADRESLNYLAPLSRLLVGAASPIGSLLEAFRSGGGVPFEAYGPDLREGQSDINRTSFLQLLGTEWIPAIPELHRRLLEEPPARVADVGCGTGWSSIGMAQAYPKVQVEGYDLDVPSIELARVNANEVGMDGRVRFHAQDAAKANGIGSYDLVTAFECIHDMSDPVSVLGAMRHMAREDGVVMVMDERVGESFTGAADEVERMMYGWSLLHCLPVGMCEKPSAGTGTVMRPDTLRQYARKAGYRDMEILPIDNFFFRFYRLHP